MRLLIVSQYFWPEHFRVNELSAELARRGWDVTVLTGWPNYPEGRILPAFRTDKAKFAKLGPVRILRVPMLARGKGKLRLMLNYLSFLISAGTIGVWKLRGQPVDAIFMFDTSPITSALPAIVLRRVKRAPLLMWVLDLWPETLAAIGVVKSANALNLVGRVVASIYSRTDRILVQSTAFSDNIRRYAGGTSRMRYFPAWAEVSETLPAAPEVKAMALGFKVLFAGNIGEAQDFPTVLDAAERCRHVAGLQFVIVGSGRMEDWLRSEIAARKLEDRIVLLGRFPVERMPEFFAAADALLVTLKPDPVFALTIPGKVQTYLASGKPIIAALDGEGARVINHARAGYPGRAGDPNMLAANILKLMALSPGQRAVMGRAGKEYCAVHFKRDDLIQRLESWIYEAISVHRGGRYKKEAVPADGTDQEQSPQ